MLPCPKFFFSFFFFHFDTNEGNFIANKGKYNQPTKNDQGGETPHHKLGVVTRAIHGHFIISIFNLFGFLIQEYIDICPMP
jgi:hypothetical protein